jgi:hypothetical protein
MVLHDLLDVSKDLISLAYCNHIDQGCFYCIKLYVQVANFHLVTKPDAMAPILVPGRCIHAGFPLIPAILVNILLTALLGCKTTLGYPPHFKVK